jgi:23S rRNA pseudouridine2605 synthase
VRARLQKLLAAAGVASRRRAEALVEAGRVRVNGRVARLGDAADPARDRIELDGRPLALAPRAFWLLHKPRGVLTTLRDPEGRPTVVDLLPPEARLARVFPVGRLDRDTEGLLLLTNDGEVAQALLHPSRGSEREYLVTARGRLAPESLRRLAAGVPIPGGVTAPARVAGVRHDARSDTTQLRLVLIEGRKRQIRRSLAALGHPVVALVRVRMGPLVLGRLPRGAARRLSPAEERRLRAHALRHGARPAAP